MNLNGFSDIGRKRLSNQDSFRIYDAGDGVAFAVVCDGMGGARGGAVASRIAADAFADSLKKFLSAGASGFSEKAYSEAMTDAAAEANTAVFSAAAADETLHGMGTTLAAVVINGETLYAANIGDSRVYLLTPDGELIQVSHDHSYVQYLVDNGKLTPEEARVSRSRHIITRAVGTDAKVESDFFVRPFPSGSRALICSDGLTNHVSDADIISILRSDMPAEQKPRTLVDMANGAGGSDNITVVVIEP
jgi:serine/threonine protein phosphatase PrpC